VPSRRFGRPVRGWTQSAPPVRRRRRSSSPRPTRTSAPSTGASDDPSDGENHAHEPHPTQATTQVPTITRQPTHTIFPTILISPTDSDAAHDPRTHHQNKH